MSGFEYSALDATGRETRGVIEADTDRHARSLLRERGLAPLAVEGITRSTAAHTGKRERFSRPRLSRKGLERVADYTENRESLRDKVMIAFIYPALVTVVAIAVVGLLLVYVVPQVTRVFANLGQTLPLVTRILIAMSDFVRASGVFWLAGL